MRLLKLVQTNAPVGVRGVIAPSLLLKSLELSEDLSDPPPGGFSPSLLCAQAFVNMRH